MTYSTDFSKLKEWMPLVMEGRAESDTVAATNMPIGTDVNFGELTRSMFNYLTSLEGVTMHFNHEVRKISKREDKDGDCATDLSSSQEKDIH
jgi:malate dehydrogenase (quinone)